MTGLQTNTYPITNLSSLSSKYRLHRIRGLRPEQDEYYQNIHAITRKLSYELKNPVTVIEREDGPCLVLRDDPTLEPPPMLDLVRCSVYFDPCDSQLVLDYTLRSPENDAICLRFLQFLVQEPIRNNKQLWQTTSGQPFFLRQPKLESEGIEQYQGFMVRATVTPDGGLGLAVDAVHRFVSRDPMPAHIARDDFGRWKGQRCIYHYGHQWYEVKVEALHDLDATEYRISDNGKNVTLLDYVVNASEKPIPPELARLPHDSSVVLYRNNRAEQRAAPSGLCYPIVDSHTRQGGREHYRTIIEPDVRHSLIRGFVKSYLMNIRFGNVRIELSSEPIRLPRRMFTMPDFEFGHSQILSVRGTADTHQVSLDALGRERLAMLRSHKAGFYVSDQLDRQYFIMPQSVLDSFGHQLLADLANEVNTLFPQRVPYDPILIPYDDRVPKNFANQGRAILEAAEADLAQPGYAVVMIHDTTSHSRRQEDQLAAMAVREMRRRFDVAAAVMHTEVGQQCYEWASDKSGSPRYRVRADRQSKLSGYLRGVALNTVLLTNHRWPFVLATPLHADTIIGIDVKHNTAGLIIVGNKGSEFRTLYKTSRQRERLLADQTCAYLVEAIREEAKARRDSIRTIAIHRDGLLFDSERNGAIRAVELLESEGTIAPDATLTMLEIPKSSPVPLRLFDVGEKDGRPCAANPQIGSYYVAGDDDGYVCTTGRAFQHRGTVRPLHVRRVCGPLSIMECLEDVFFLAGLAWTRPEDCARYPITTKLNDRFLGEEAGQYDKDALEFSISDEDVECVV